MTRIADFTKERRKEVTGPLLKTVFNIFETWGLSSAQQQTVLGLHNKATFFNWKKNPEKATLSNDLLERTSYILGIWRSLQILLPEENLADNWITSPNQNAAFNGQSPLERILGGQVVDLAYVRNHLDAERGGW